MATPPTFVAEYESVWNTTTSPKTATVSANTNEVLVVFGITADNTATLGTPTGGGYTYTQQQVVNVSSRCWIAVWTAVANSNQTNFTLSISRSGGTTIFWGFNCLRFSGSDGVGASSSTNAASGAPTLNITAEAANSAIVVGNGDWNALDGARTWRTNAGSFTEQTYFRDSGQYTVYGGYHPDAGTASTDAVGLSAPSGQAYAIVAVEVKGSASGTQTVVTNLLSVTTSIFNPTVSPGSVAVVVPLVSVATTLFNPAVIQLIATILISSPTVLFNPSVTPGSVSVAASLIEVPTTILNPSVIQNISAVLINTSSTILEPSIAVGPVNVGTSVLSVPSTLYDPVVVNNGAILVPALSVPTTLFDPSVVSLVQVASVPLLSVLTSIFSPFVAGGGVAAVMGSIADRARVNMLVDRSFIEPRLETNPDLMRIVLDDPTQTLVTATNASAGTHLLRYMMSLR